MLLILLLWTSRHARKGNHCNPFKYWIRGKKWRQGVSSLKDSLHFQRGSHSTCKLQEPDHPWFLDCVPTAQSKLHPLRHEILSNTIKILLVSLKPKVTSSKSKTRSNPYKRRVIVVDRPTQNVPIAGVRRRQRETFCEPGHPVRKTICEFGYPTLG